MPLEAMLPQVYFSQQFAGNEKLLFGVNLAKPLVSARLEPAAMSGGDRKPGEQRLLLSNAAENTNGTAFSKRAG